MLRNRKEYTVNQYHYGVERHYKTVGERRASSATCRDRVTQLRTWRCGAVALWGWARLIPDALGKAYTWNCFPNVMRLHDEINSRPAAAAVERLLDEYKFRNDMDEEVCRFSFRNWNARD